MSYFKIQRLKHSLLDTLHLPMLMLGYTLTIGKPSSFE